MPAVVILGAGASYDSVDVGRAFDPANLIVSEDYRPPLLTQLFEPRGSTFAGVMARTPAVAPLVVELRNAVAEQRSLEELLDLVHARAEQGDAAAAKQLMGMRFYLREVISMCSTWSARASNATNYHWLVDRLDRWARSTGDSVAYITFNYDTLLEQAMTAVLGQGFNTFDDYLLHPRARLYKPHGSITWAYLVNQPPPFNSNDRDWLIANAATVQADDLRVRHDWDSGITGDAWVPALAVPMTRKDESILPGSHAMSLLNDLESANRVLVIGWRASERKFVSLATQAFPKRISRFLALCHDSETGENVAERLFPETVIERPCPTRRLDFSMMPGDDATVERFLS